MVIERRMRLSRAAWERHRTIPVTVDGLAPCLPMFGVTTEWPVPSEVHLI
jgi:hypothetical protein